MYLLNFLRKLIKNDGFELVDANKKSHIIGKPKKEIPIGLNCSKETYRERINRQQQNTRREKMNLSTKYQLLPADYSPPTLRKGGLENFSAISGPALPSGPHLPNSDGISNYTNFSDDDMGSDSTLSDVETLSMSNYSGTLKMCKYIFKVVFLEFPNLNRNSMQLNPTPILE